MLLSIDSKQLVHVWAESDSLHAQGPGCKFCGAIQSLRYYYVRVNQIVSLIIELPGNSRSRCQGGRVVSGVRLKFWSTYVGVGSNPTSDRRFASVGGEKAQLVL